MPIKPHRPLDAREQLIAQEIFKRVANDDVAVYALIRENVVYRTELPKIRKQRRCLPAGAQAALDALPHHHATAVEFNQN
jgi:hypothetical protein